MRAACLGYPPTITLRSTAKLVRPPPRTYPHTTRLLVMAEVPTAYRVSVHSSCPCNEIRALTERHLVQCWTPGQLVDQAKHFRSVAYDLPVPPGKHKMSKYGMALEYDGAKKRAYMRAYHNLKQGLKLKSWTTVKMFVKPDKYPEGEVYSKAPRAIQYRSPEYNLLVGSFLRPYEKAIYPFLTSNVGMPAVAKGLNNMQRASNIVDASKLFSSPVYLMLDHSKFDSHVEDYHLKWLHRQYVRATGSRWLRYLLSFTINNRCYSKGGMAYTVRGGRMSGDYDTALGNTLLNYRLMQTWLGTVKSHVLLDGDDSVVIVEKRDYDTLLSNFRHFEDNGFHTKLETCHELWQVEFCRSKLIPTDPPVFGREPIRALSNMAVNLRDYHGAGYLRFLAGVGKGELCASAGIPIISKLAKVWEGLSDNPILSDRHHAYGMEAADVEVTDEVREYYARQWGITRDQQINIESNIRTPVVINRAEYLISWYDSLPFNLTCHDV